jgi:2-polyprenyl-6-methoxyphenol hydroxylase-like FAD-dependent oxidoreductase
LTQSPAAAFARLNTTQRPGPVPVTIDRAIVLGGSLAGLLSARVLADHAKQVLIIERDDAAADYLPAGRPGLPQGLQLHALLPAGRAQLDRWFPGLTQEAQEAGAVLSGPAATAAYADDLRQVETANSILLTCSRPLLETLVRRRTLALPPVRLVKGKALGLACSGDSVTGVRYSTAGDQEVTEDADFVVDAMGRASKVSDWLEAGGWDRPELQRCAAGIHYSTAYFKRAEDHPEIAAAIARYSPRFPEKLLGAMSAIEDGQWMVMLAGYGNAHPARSLADFRLQIGQLPPVFAQAVTGDLVGEIKSYSQADSRRRHFADLGRLPARLISVGDAVASFNPVYGQGMSSAALHASCLSEYLCSAPDLAGPARQFFALQKIVVDAAWEMSTTADAARLDSGRPPAKVRLLRWAADQVLAAAMVDEQIATCFNEVTGMTAHPATLATPATLLRAIKVNRSARRS